MSSRSQVVKDVLYEARGVITRQESEIRQLRAIQEVIFDMTWDFQHWLNHLDPEARSEVVDRLDGSRGVFAWVKHQADLFQARWESTPEDQRVDYLSSVYYWMHSEASALVARMKLEVDEGQ